MQSGYDERLTGRLRDLILEGYAKQRELNLNEIQNLLGNPAVDPNIKIHNRGPTIPHCIVLNSDIHIRLWGEPGLREILTMLELWGRRWDFEVNCLFRDEGTALIHDAVRNRDTYNPRILSAVLKLYNIDVNLRTRLLHTHQNTMRTALDFAVENNNLEAVQILLEEGRANPNVRFGDHGLTLLEYLVANDDEHAHDRQRFDMIKLFLDHGYIVNRVGTNDSLSLLHRCKDVDVCKLLLDRGCDPLIINQDGINALRYALSMNRADISNTIRAWAENMHSATQYALRKWIGRDPTEIVAAYSYPSSDRY